MSKPLHLSRIARTALKPVLSAALAVALIIAVCSSCAEPEPPAEIKEDTREIFFNILSSENNYSSDINLKKVSAFYASALPAELPAKLASEQFSADLNLSAAIDRSILGADEEYTDFILNLLRDASLSVSVKNDPAPMNSFTSIDILLSGQKLAGADIIVEGGERIAANLRELYPTYVALEYTDLMNIFSDATGIDAFGQTSYGGLMPIIGKLKDISGITDIGKERADAITKPFLDKLKETLSADNVAVYRDSPFDGAPEGAYTKVSVRLADEDLRQLLTALVQAAKDNTELFSFIKERYSAVYDIAMELSEYGIIDAPGADTFPPVENIDGILQSTLAAMEAMLGSSSGFPLKALSIDLYADGSALKCVYVNGWTSLPEQSRNNEDTGGGAQSASAGAGAAQTQQEIEPASVNSASVIENAGKPQITLCLKSYGEEDGTRIDSITFSIVNDEGDVNAISLSSRLSGDNNSGANSIEADFDGPAFTGGVPNLSFNFTRDGGSKKFSLKTTIKGKGGDILPLISVYGALTDAGKGGAYEIAAGLDMNDPRTVAAEAKAITAVTSGGKTGSASGAVKNSDESYVLSIRCDGVLTFEKTVIPELNDEDVLMLVQDSFYDGTFESIFNEFYINLIRFASANRQLLSLYGFPGF